MIALPGHRLCGGLFVFSVFALFPREGLDAPQGSHGDHDTHAEKHREPRRTLGPRNQVEERPDTPEDQDSGSNQHHLQPDNFFHFIDGVR